VAILRSAVAGDGGRVAAILIGTRAAFMPYAPSAHTDDEIVAWVAGHLIPTGGVTVAVAASADQVMDLSGERRRP
jgi:hypothetical protein